MATVYMNPQGKIEVGRNPQPVEYQGKQRVLLATFTTAATATTPGTGPINNADIAVAGFLRKGTTILPGGFLQNGVFGASTTATVGTYTRSGNTFTAVSAARYLGSTSVAAAALTAVASTTALSVFDTLTQDLYIVITAGGANYANGIAMTLYLPYVQD